MKNLTKMLRMCILLLLFIKIIGYQFRRVYNDKFNIQVPYYVQVVNNKQNYLCGGVIVANNWILTSAHCLEGEKKNDLRVMSGAKPRRFKKSHKIADLIVHENYRFGTNENNIGLIKLQDPLEFNDEQKPIKIRSSPLNKNDRWLKVSGIGAIDDVDDYPQSAQSSYLPIVRRKMCRKKYYPFEEFSSITGDMLCLGSNDSHAYWKNSGGPAVDINSNELVGIVSWGRNVCIPEPIVVTNVINYRDWIEKTMDSQSDDVLIGFLTYEDLLFG